MSPVFGHGRLRLYLLKLLDESPRHGYDVIRALEDRFLGLYAPSAGTVYPRLSRLEAEGLIEHAEEDGRKVYRITEAGRRELESRRAELADIEEDIAGSVRDLAQEIRTDVRGSVQQLRDELKAAARDMRRESRVRGRDEARRPERDPQRTEAESAVDWLRSELHDLSRQRRLTTEQVHELRDLMQRTIDEARRIVAR
jgi:DNA-binding PadR family transcriptional regulator